MFIDMKHLNILRCERRPRSSLVLLYSFTFLQLGAKPNLSLVRQPAYQLDYLILTSLPDILYSSFKDSSHEVSWLRSRQNCHVPLNVPLLCPQSVDNLIHQCIITSNEGEESLNSASHPGP